MIWKIFSKCGMILLFLPLVAALFFMSGCLEKSPGSPGISKGFPEAQIKPVEVYPSGLRADFDSDVSGSLFRVQGDLAPFGNGSFPYLLLKASLQKGGVELKSTKYLMIDVKSGGDQGFEIAKNMRIPKGNYNCTLEISGPTGTLACETRGCRVTGPWTESPSARVGVSGESRPVGAVDGRSKSSQGESDGLREGAEEAGTLKREDRAEKSLRRVEEGAVRTEDPVSGSPGPGSQVSRMLFPERNASYAVGSPDQKVADTAGIRAEKYAETNADARYADTDAYANADAKSADAKFMGSSSSKKYHRLDCRYALKIKADKRIYFSSEEDAKSQGYLPCKVCNP